MGDRRFHVEKAARNEAFYSGLDAPNLGFDEWVVTVLFYIIMHYVDGALATDPALSQGLQHPSSHMRRNQAVAKSPQLSSIEITYLNLYDRSRDARYNLIEFRPGFLREVEGDYRNMRSSLRAILGL